AKADNQISHSSNLSNLQSFVFSNENSANFVDRRFESHTFPKDIFQRRFRGIIPVNVAADSGGLPVIFERSESQAPSSPSAGGDEDNTSLLHTRSPSFHSQPHIEDLDEITDFPNLPSSFPTHRLAKPLDKFPSPTNAHNNTDNLSIYSFHEPTRGNASPTLPTKHNTHSSQSHFAHALDLSSRGSEVKTEQSFEPSDYCFGDHTLDRNSHRPYETAQNASLRVDIPYHSSNVCISVNASRYPAKNRSGASDSLFAPSFSSALMIPSVQGAEAKQIDPEDAVDMPKLVPSRSVREMVARFEQQKFSPSSSLEMHNRKPDYSLSAAIPSQSTGPVVPNDLRQTSDFMFLKPSLAMSAVPRTSNSPLLSSSFGCFSEYGIRQGAQNSSSGSSLSLGKSDTIIASGKTRSRIKCAPVTTSTISSDASGGDSLGPGPGASVLPDTASSLTSLRSKGLQHPCPEVIVSNSRSEEYGVKRDPDHWPAHAFTRTARFPPSPPSSSSSLLVSEEPHEAAVDSSKAALSGLSDLKIDRDYLTGGLIKMDRSLDHFSSHLDRIDKTLEGIQGLNHLLNSLNIPPSGELNRSFKDSHGSPSGQSLVKRKLHQPPPQPTGRRFVSDNASSLSLTDSRTIISSTPVSSLLTPSKLSSVFTADFSSSPQFLEFQARNLDSARSSNEPPSTLQRKSPELGDVPVKHREYLRAEQDYQPPKSVHQSHPNLLPLVDSTWPTGETISLTSSQRSGFSSARDIAVSRSVYSGETTFASSSMTPFTAGQDSSQPVAEIARTGLFAQ
ncbi:unnamed protein product, partial [Protopolystoma xenopodis]